MALIWKSLDDSSRSGGRSYILIDREDFADGEALSEKEVLDEQDRRIVVIGVPIEKEDF